MMRLILLFALIGAAILYMREPARRQAFPTADIPLVPPVAAPMPVAATPVPLPEPIPATTLVDETPAAPEVTPRPAKPVARRASPIQTSPVPPAIAVLESPSAGLANRVSAVPRLPVTEILPDGSTRTAGGPSEPALPLARVLPRRPAKENMEAKADEQLPAAPAVTAGPPSQATGAPAPRPSQADAFFKNAARILAETEIPK